MKFFRVGGEPLDFKILKNDIEYATYSKAPKVIPGVTTSATAKSATDGSQACALLMISSSLSIYFVNAQFYSGMLTLYLNFLQSGIFLSSKSNMSNGLVPAW